VGDKSEWIHYSKISRILSPIDFRKLQNSSDSSSSEEDSEWFKEMEPKETDPETCSNPPKVKEIDVSIEPEPVISTNPSNSNDSVVNQFDGSTRPPGLGRHLPQIGTEGRGIGHRFGSGAGQQ